MNFGADFVCVPLSKTLWFLPAYFSFPPADDFYPDAYIKTWWFNFLHEMSWVCDASSVGGIPELQEHFSGPPSDGPDYVKSKSIAIFFPLYFGLTENALWEREKVSCRWNLLESNSHISTSYIAMDLHGVIYYVTSSIEIWNYGLFTLVPKTVVLCNKITVLQWQRYHILWVYFGHKIAR